MIVYRLSRQLYANDLSGKGAEIAGGRWNSKGTPLIYTAESRALCTAEVAVHIPLGILPNDYQMIEIYFPDETISTISTEDLPENWNSIPHNRLTQMVGDQFVKTMEFLVLKVPSAVVLGDYNYLINPLHDKISEVKIKQIVDYQFDQRLFFK